MTKSELQARIERLTKAVKGIQKSISKDGSDMVKYYDDGDMVSYKDACDRLELHARYSQDWMRMLEEAKEQLEAAQA